MAEDTSITRRLDDIAVKLEEIAGTDPGALRDDTTITARLARIAAAVQGGVLEDHAIGAHLDVVSTSPSLGQLLEYNGTDWVNVTQVLTTHGDVGTTTPTIGNVLRGDGTLWQSTALVLSDLPAIAIDDLSDVDVSGATIDQVLIKGAGDWTHLIFNLIALKDVAIPGSVDNYQILRYLSGISAWVNEDLDTAGKNNGLLHEDGTIPLVAAWDAQDLITATGFAIDATIDHSIADESDGIAIINANSNGDIILRCNSQGTSHDLITIDSSGPSLRIEPTGGAAALTADGIIDVQGSWQGAGVHGIMNFAPTLTGGVPIGFFVRPTYDGVTLGEGITLQPTIAAGQDMTFHGITLKPGNVATGQDQTYIGLNDQMSRVVNATGTQNYTGVKWNGTIISTAGAVVCTDIGIDLTGGVVNVSGATVVQYGLRLQNYGAITGAATVFAIHGNGGNWAQAADNAKILLGAGYDTEMYYDSADFVIDTGAIAASDIKIDCGPNKTIELQETVWDDLRTPVSAVKRLGLTDPDWAQIEDDGAGSVGVYILAFDDGAAEEVFFTLQMPHSYKEGTDLEPHIHWTPFTADTGDVEWSLEYTIANINGTFGNTTDVKCVDAGDGTIAKHQVCAFATISGTGLTISHMILCRLYRDGGNGNDDFSGDAGLLEFDLHFEKDTIGSRQEIVK